MKKLLEEVDGLEDDGVPNEKPLLWSISTALAFLTIMKVSRKE